MIKKREENEKTLRNSYKKSPINFLGDYMYYLFDFSVTG